MKKIHKTSNNSRLVLPTNFTQILFVVLFSFMCCLEAQAQIYWVSFGATTVNKADIDGTNVNSSFITGLGSTSGVVIDPVNSKIYYTTNSTTIGRADLDGSNANNSFITVAQSGSLAIDPVNGHIFWASFNAGKIGRANLDGTAINNDFVTGITDSPNGIDVDAVNGKIYFTRYNGFGGIGIVDLDGNNLNNSFLTGIGGQPIDVVVDNTNDKILYSARNANIGRADLDGNNNDPSFMTGLAFVQGLAIDAATGKLYYHNNNSIGQANLDGTSANNDFVTGASNVWALAALAPPAPIPTLSEWGLIILALLLMTLGTLYLLQPKFRGGIFEQEG